MIPRKVSKSVLDLAKGFPILAVVGPRQSGKTTLVKSLFPDKPYVSLEDLDQREYASRDPRGFLQDFPNGAILDETQRVPALFSYLQTHVDQYPKPGLFILTGSQHFLLMENISQSLAGRVAIVSLLPLSLDELVATNVGLKEPEPFFLRGFYPKLYTTPIATHDWYSNYLQTYLEKDVRQIKNISDLSVFQKFLKLCANRVGQLLNLSSLSVECGVTHNTIRAWLSVLEASFIVFLLPPYYRNFNKRLTKMPKLYFYDIGLASHLLGLTTLEQVRNHPLRGAIFENLVLAEILKAHHQNLQQPQIYFWRDKTGHEVDCLLERGLHLLAIEIKASKTVQEHFFGELFFWNKIAKTLHEFNYVVYAGDARQQRSIGTVVPWHQVSSLLDSQA